MASDFSVRHTGSQAIKIPQETDSHPGILYSAGPPIKYKGQIKMFTLKRAKQQVISHVPFLKKPIKLSTKTSIGQEQGRHGIQKQKI